MKKKIFRVAAGLFAFFALFVWKALPAQEAIPSPVRIDRVEAAGNKITAQDVILREIPFAFPAVLSADDLKLIQNRVQNLRLFNRVELRVDEREGLNVLTVLVTESWYIFPSPVFFISERDWSKLSYGLQLSDGNFRGRNEKLRVGGWFGYNPSYFLSYSVPWIGEEQRLNLSVGLSQAKAVNKIFGFQEDRLGFNVKLGKRLSLKLDTSLQFSLTRVSLLPEYQSFSVSGSGRDLVPNLSWLTRWDNRDLAEYPRKGTYLSLNVQRTGFARTQPEYWRMTVDGRFYQPVLGTSALAVRQLFILNSGFMPVYDRIFLGYNERVRGYYNLVLPDPARFAEFPSYSISLTSLEFRFPILPIRYFSIENGPLIPSLFRNLKFGLSAGFFVDNAFVWRSAADIRLKDFYTGYGAGLHFHLPYIDVFRIEYALNKFGRGQLIFNAGISF